MEHRSFRVRNNSESNTVTGLPRSQKSQVKKKKFKVKEKSENFAKGQEKS